MASLLAYTILGMLWYGPLFGHKWMALSGLEGKDMNSPEMKKAQTAGYISSLISSFIAMTTLAVAMKAMGIGGAIGGLLTGAGLSFGFIAMSFVGNAVWADTPWALVVINSGYRVCGLTLGGLIIGIWQ